MSAIEAIIRKEWIDTLQNKTIVWTFVGMAAVFSLLPLALGFGVPALVGENLSSDPDVALMSNLLLEVMPGFANLTPIQQFQVYVLRQMLPLFLLLPILGAMSIATYSIIGEKTSRSLEALLATPTSTRDILLGKALASTVPSVLGAWAFFGLLVVVVRLLGGPEVLTYAFDMAAWALILLISPVVAFLALGLGVIVSSRSTDPRSAQQIASILVLPIVGLIIGQSTGLFLLGLGPVLVAAVVLLILDLIVLRLGIRLFQREHILTRWK